jgi:hypothetical protein
MIVAMAKTMKYAGQRGGAATEPNPWSFNEVIR